MIKGVRQFLERVRAYVRNDDGVCWGWFEVAQELRQGCVLSLLLFNVLLCDTPRCTTAIKRGGGYSRRPCRSSRAAVKGWPETALECARRAIWEMMYADDAYIGSRSPRGLNQMMVVFVGVFGTFELDMSESKTETMCMPIPRAPATQIVYNATGQQYRQTVYNATGQQYRPTVSFHLFRVCRH